MKSNVYRVLFGVLFPIAFLFLFFLAAGFEHGTTCWIGLGFIMFSYLFMMITPLFVPASKSSHIFSVTSGSMSTGYFALNLVAGLVFMIWDFEQWKIAIGVEVVLLVVFLLMFLPMLITDEATAKKENAQQRQIYTVKLFTSRVKVIADTAADLQIKKEVQRVYGELSSCPSKSNNATNSVDGAISQAIDHLENIARSGDYEATRKQCAVLSDLVRRRKEFSKM